VLGRRKGKRERKPDKRKIRKRSGDRNVFPSEQHEQKVILEEEKQ